jgi:uncharacterized protein (TIGR03032 family)
MSKETPATKQAKKSGGSAERPTEAKAAAAQPAKKGISIQTVEEPKAQAGAAPQGAQQQQAQQQSKLSVSRGFPNWLASVKASLAFTSYQTGPLFLVGLRNDKKVSFNQQNFVRAMGVHTDGSRLYVGGIAQIWRLENILKKNERANEHFDRVFVPRAAVTIGDIDVHEIGIDKFGRTIFVNTKYSCLATTSQTHSFRPLWKPKFISKLAAEDRCHLNGLCMVDGLPKYVTAVSRSDVLNGWRERRHEGGVLIEVETDRIVTDQLSMPHSPRFYDGKIWVLDSGRGFLIKVDPKTGKSEDVAFCPGFLRGLSFYRGFAVVTSSLPRDGTFQGLQLDQNIKARDGEARCGIFVINVRTGDIVEWIGIDGHIKELFDVTIVPGAQCPMSIGLGSTEIQSMITFEPTFAPLNGPARPAAVQQGRPAAAAPVSVPAE